MTAESRSEIRSFWRSGWGIALCALLALAALVFILEHRLHALQWLPYALLLACPLLHFFMHRGHHHGSEARRKDRTPDE
jgi:hypothetical protein